METRGTECIAAVIVAAINLAVSCVEGTKGPRLSTKADSIACIGLVHYTINMEGPSKEARVVG